jgi:hypothetical protein
VLAAPARAIRHNGPWPTKFADLQGIAAAVSRERGKLAEDTAPMICSVTIEFQAATLEVGQARRKVLHSSAGQSYMADHCFELIERISKSPEALLQSQGFYKTLSVAPECADDLVLLFPARLWRSSFWRRLLITIR